MPDQRRGTSPRRGPPAPQEARRKAAAALAPEEGGTPLLPGAVVEHYRVAGEIGAGGMGVVYRARDEHLQRDVAIKVLARRSSSSPASHRQFRKEALALSRVNHPNIATVFDFTTFDGTDVLVMEYIQGETLGQRLADGALPEPDVRRLGEQLADGLAAAHREGVIHRDLKPSNLRITPDRRLKILDFGLAWFLRPTGDTSTYSDQSLRPAGTPSYMAPEVILGKSPDERTDVYGVGAVLYEMATGARAFPQAYEGALVGSILQGELIPPSRLKRDLSPGLEAIILKALDKDPDRRYQSARELQVDLERLSRPVSVRQPLHPRRWMGAAALVAVAGVAAWWASARWPESPGAFRERDWVLIADFDHSDDDHKLSASVRISLETALQQSAYVNVVPRERVRGVLGRMRQPLDARIDEATGLEICRREGIRMLLVGDILQSGEATRIAVRGLDPATGGSLFTEREDAHTRDDVVGRVDALARRVRRTLGESVVRIQETSLPLARVTTDSYAALEAYSAATKEVVGGNHDAARALLTAAVEEDPRFAMAHRLLARVYQTKGDRQMELAHLERAYALPAGEMTERERFFIASSYHTVQGHYEQAVESLKALVSLYPDDLAAHFSLASAYRNLNRLGDAISELRTVLKLDPNDQAAYAELALVLARAGQYEDALAAVASGTRRGADTPRLAWGRGVALVGLGRLADARGVFRAMAGTDLAVIAKICLTRIDIYEGRFGSAVRELEADIRREPLAAAPSPYLLRRYLLACIHCARGEPAEVRRQARAMLDAGEPDALQTEDLRRAGTLLARIGDASGARVALARLDDLRGRHPTTFNISAFHNLSGEIGLADGRTADAIQVFRTAHEAYPRVFSLQGLARAHEATGDWAAAAAAWGRVLERSGEILQDGFTADVALAHLQRARALGRLNDVDEARRDYEAFLGLWREADDLAVLRDARQELRALDAAR